jgi:hypothetical protein
MLLRYENHIWVCSTSIYRSSNFTFPPGHFKHRFMIYDFPQSLQINAGTIYLNRVIICSFYATWKSLHIYNVTIGHQDGWITERINLIVAPCIFSRITSIHQPTNAHIISHKTLLKHFKTLWHVSILSDHHQGALFLAKVMLQYSQFNSYLQTSCCDNKK